MKFPFLVRSGAICLSLSAYTLARAVAQAPAEARNLALDTLQPANPKQHHEVARILTTGGTRLYVFIVAISERGTGLSFSYTNPLVLPRPKTVFLSSEQIKWARFGGAYWEPLRVEGERASHLAERVVSGPTELFDYATLKKGVPIPLPVPGASFVPIIWTGAFRERYNHAWYVRRAGSRTMESVPKGDRKCAEFLADYLAPMPTLADSIRAQATGYGYDDLPRLLTRYNRRKAR